MPGSRALAITLGDPAGIGPEIVAAALADGAAPGAIVYGHRAILARAAQARGLALPADLRVVEPDGVPAPGAEPGHPDETSGAAQVAYLEAAVAAARRGEVDAIATAPISKTWARRAGFAFPGHTEMLAARLIDDPAARDVVMLFAGPRLTVALATIHVPLARVPAALADGRLATTIALVAEALRRDFAIAAPRIGVLGLNPHAGEHGLLGDDEVRAIEPAIAAARARVPFAAITGPLVPDAAFRGAVDRTAVDALVAMYHDQGLIPVKLIDFDDSVNVTLGLPIVRTSPDHGTAYDIAGRGIARATSMRAAIALAVAMAARRRAGELPAASRA